MSGTYNLPERIELFVNTTFEWAKHFVGAGPGGDVMFTMGGDFNYQAPAFSFSNIDKLIHYLAIDGRLNVFYSTPATYAAAKREAVLSSAVPTTTDDFFPYADGSNAFWTARTPVPHHACVTAPRCGPCCSVCCTGPLND